MTAIGMLVLGVVLLAAMAAGAMIAGEIRAGERQRLAARRWHLYCLEQEIFYLAEFRGCSSCELLRRRGFELPPPD